MVKCEFFMRMIVLVSALLFGIYCVATHDKQVASDVVDNEEANIIDGAFAGY